MKFKHYNGGEYELVTLASDEATNLPVVVYKALKDGTVWSRPARVFLERVAPGTERFSLILPPGQALTCDAGCEYPKLTVEAFEFSREESPDGVLVESRSKPVWACRCGEEIHVYHEIDGSVTDLDEPTPAPPIDVIMAHLSKPAATFVSREGVAAVLEALGRAETPSREYLARLVEGMEVSVDISTCEDDAHNRVFGKITEAMDHPEGKHGVILLVQSDVQPNFKPRYASYPGWASEQVQLYWSNATPTQAAMAAWDAARETK